MLQNFDSKMKDQHNKLVTLSRMVERMDEKIKKNTGKIRTNFKKNTAVNKRQN